MEVTNHTIYRDNPYHSLIYRDDSPYKAVKGTVFDAIDRLDADKSNILHIHWEEDILRRAKTGVEADVIIDRYTQGLEEFCKKGGVILWTVHNRLPHELHNLEQFNQMRRCLCELSRRILVHNMDALSVLQEQVEVDLSKVFYLPHPSYLGVYETQRQSEQGLSDLPQTPNFLIFGRVRAYKGISPFVREFGSRAPAPVHIVGTALEEEYAADVRALVDACDAITWREERVDDADVPSLMRSATALVAPYERTLTSGALMCAMSFGVPMIAPGAPGFYEALPREAHRFLYDPKTPDAIVDAMTYAASLTVDEMLAIRRALFDRAVYYHPDRVGDTFSSLLQTVGRARPAMA